MRELKDNPTTLALAAIACAVAGIVDVLWILPNTPPGYSAFTVVFALAMMLGGAGMACLAARACLAADRARKQEAEAEASQ